MGYLVAIVVAVLCSGPAARAQESVESRARRIESQVWSPYCAGRLLVDCTTAQADDLRARIADRLTDGQTEAQVMRWLRDNYGDEVLARPRPGPEGLFVWLVPVAALGAGAVVLVGVIRRWRRGAPPSAEAGDEPVPDAERDYWIRRVREEVERDP